MAVQAGPVPAAKTRTTPPPGRRRQLAAILPMALDMAAPMISFVLLHLVLGVSPVIALTAGAFAAGLRVLYLAVRERRISAFSVLMLLIMAATIVLVLITGDPRLILAKSALIPALGGTWGIITNFVGRPLVFDVAGPFITKGDPELAASWRTAWEHEPEFVARLKLLNLIWGIGFLISAVLRVVIVYHVPLTVGVFAGQVPTLGGLVILILLTRRLGRPLMAAVHRQAAIARSTL
ncbi:hypothetical protein GCM10010435_35660 [Winogradskya consettensis]|uniref:Intracellular septation protein A n=1 Tax=Winogradskya consettensis TaxID=113560 RepID=A0A919VM47_9ACTN|nr:VC0807 family protein [Actinoplanes consettensis]GIM68465.1 hypothetical protein Aco04nite_10870 [Actinoplanes consettensis]